MSNQISKEEAIERMQSEDSQELLAQYMDLPAPQLANGNDFIYKAFKRPYAGAPGTYVLIILANGWYYPTPELDLYFETDGQGKFKLMQRSSSAGFFLITYHNAQWTSGAGVSDLGETITIEDAHGTRTVKVELM